MDLVRKFLIGLLSIAPLSALAQTAAQAEGSPATRTGVSAIWFLANVSYAGMRAQNSASAGWRIVAFIFGFPGTLISFLAVGEGSERAYGIDIPRRRPPGGGT